MRSRSDFLDTRFVVKGITVSSQREIQVFKLSPSRCNRQAQHHLLRRAEVDAFFTVLSGNANPIDRLGGSSGFGGVISPPSASNTGLSRARVLRMKVSRRTDKPFILFSSSVNRSAKSLCVAAS